MINATTDRLLTLAEAAKICPKVGRKRPSKTTLWRWGAKGLHGVTLEHIWSGHTMLTTEAAVNEFFRLVAEARSAQRVAHYSARSGARAPQPHRRQTSTEKQREREIAKAKDSLVARGMLPRETEH